jgi:hypothetical protein
MGIYMRMVSITAETNRNNSAMGDEDVDAGI